MAEEELGLTPPDRDDLCNERVAQCYCGKPARHREQGDYTHECSYAGCRGQWRGREGFDTFEVVRFPLARAYLLDPSADAWRIHGI